MAVLYSACSDFSWSVGYVLDEVSLVTLMLLLRQKLNVDGKIGLTLADKERIMSTDWDKLVEESHRRVCRGV